MEPTRFRRTKRQLLCAIWRMRRTPRAGAYLKTSLGATINLNAGGDYGWCIDKEETTQALLQAIEDETQGNLDPVYLYTANDRSANDIGNTYVEVCISQQKMWCYKDGVLVTETPVTTGNHATGYDTPAGSVWAVDAKKK